MVAKIDEGQCIGCGSCVATCQFDAIVMENGVAQVKEEDCKGCGACVSSCPVDAISMI